MRRALGALKLASCARSARWQCAREAGRFFSVYFDCSSWTYIWITPQCRNTISLFYTKFRPFQNLEKNYYNFLARFYTFHVNLPLKWVEEHLKTSIISKVIHNLRKFWNFSQYFPQKLTKDFIMRSFHA